MERTESEFVRKEPCPSCGSKDNLGRYSDGHAHCFTHGCGHYEHATNEEGDTPRKVQNKMAKELLQGGSIVAMAQRGLTLETCQKFGYSSNKLGEKRCQVAPYYDANGLMVAQKIRMPGKDFCILGSIKTAGLFGQQLWGDTGRKIVVTEGEIDAMSVSQMQGNKWPVVSIPTGADGAKKALEKNLKWLCGFDEVILMFDMDAPGREAMVECAALFPPGKCKIASLPLKDPNEMLVAQRGDEIVQAIWQAKAYRPDGVVALGDIIEAAMTPVQVGLPWCFPTLTKLTYGRRWCEVYTLGAGTGIGKTDFLTQQIAFDVLELKEKVGLLFLEQQPRETAVRLAGKVAGKRFHIPDAGWTPDELRKTLTDLDAAKGLFFYDSFGVAEWDTLAAHIRFMNKSEGVRIFYLDHLTALAAGADDERKELERVMADLASLAKELEIVLIVISHLATPEGKPHEEGGRVMIRHFKGSRAIGFWSYYMFGLERDQQAQDVAMRSITTFRVLKDRYTGNATGEVFYLGYDKDTGQLFETELPAEDGGFKDETPPAF